MMAFHRRMRRPLAWLLLAGFTGLLIKQVVAITQHGFDGWLTGEGQNQTEWEVRATLVLLAVLLFGAVFVFARAGEAGVRRWKDWRMIRAIRRESPHQSSDN